MNYTLVLIVAVLLVCCFEAHASLLAPWTSVLWTATLDRRLQKRNTGSLVVSPKRSRVGRIVHQNVLEDVLYLSNLERIRFGLPELAFSAELSKAAQLHAECMARNFYFDHTGINGSKLDDRVKSSTNYRFSHLGENLFWRYPENDPQAAVNGWMRSKGHRENLLHKDFEEVGLGYAVSGDNHYYVQVFGTPVKTPIVAGHGDTLESLYLLTNLARSKMGLFELDWSEKLHTSAQRHADNMARMGELYSCDSVYETSDGFSRLAANMAYRSPYNDPYDAFYGWLDKRSSADYILSNKFTDVGVGYAQSGEQHYYVKLYGTPHEGFGGYRYQQGLYLPPGRTF
jgi:uncharacterized protein YkwD